MGAAGTTPWPEPERSRRRQASPAGRTLLVVLGTWLNGLLPGTYRVGSIGTDTVAVTGALIPRGGSSAG